MRQPSKLRARIGQRAAALRVALARLRRPLLALGLLALVALGAIGLRRIKREVERFPDIQIHPRAFRPLAVPGWADPSLVTSLRETSAAMPSFNILESDLKGALDRRYRTNPWIREITRVQKDFPNRLTVTARVRRPIAVVEHPRRGRAEYTPVDGACVRLPGSSESRPGSAAVPTPVIRGSELPAPPAGRVWDDDAVRDGVAVARELYELYNSPVHEQIGIEVIDVSNAGGRVNRAASEIVLVTRSGKEIQWGRSARARAFGEPEPAKKVAHLARILESYPNLAGVQLAKVYFEQPYVVLESPTKQAGGSESGGDFALSHGGAVE